ncbi:phage tail protein [Hyphococcus sp. DH-69]|uniref:phage tail protein n=1 Tax=Hyphococcus formosus TaxID=3143534 RepID=UPI00398BB0AC
MVDADRQYVYAWDARPFPDFPARSDIWGDTANWEKGHWLNGRLGRAPLGLLVSALADEAGMMALEAHRLEGVVTGYIIDRPMSAREMIDPLADIYQFDVVETGGTITCQPRHAAPVLSLGVDDLLAQDEGAFSHHLAQEADLPSAFRLGFIDEQDEYGTAVAEARDPGARPIKEIGIDLAAVIPAAEAEARARSILADAWVMRETLKFTLPPSALAIEPGDSITLHALGEGRHYRITEIDDAGARECALVRVSPDVYNAPVGPAIFTPPPSVPVYSAPIWEVMDLPMMGAETSPMFAAFSDPWPGGVALYRSAGGAPLLAGRAPARAVMGRLESALAPAPSGRWVKTTADLRLAFGNLASRQHDDIFAGANTLCVLADNGGWEVMQFRDATLNEDGSWRVSRLLRGQAGTEAEAQSGASLGARVVLLSPAVTPIEFSSDLRGLEFDWQAGPEQDIPDTENFTRETMTLTQRALLPLSPVHLKAKRTGDDIALSWVRRTRSGGDSWQGDVPLGEVFERYRIRIFDGETMVRTEEVDAPLYHYVNADMVTDFGGVAPEHSITISVAQLSDAVGDGIAAHRELVIG